MSDFLMALVVFAPIYAFVFFAGCAIRYQWRKTAHQLALAQRLNAALEGK